MSSTKNTIMKTPAIVLAMHPFSQTSRIVTFLAPFGIVSTLAKGALRPKSHLLGQYDLHYTCELLYHVSGEMHPLHEVSPIAMRTFLRTDWRANALAAYAAANLLRIVPHAAATLAPNPDAENFYSFHESFLDSLSAVSRAPEASLRALLAYELEFCSLAGVPVALESPAPGQDFVEYRWTPGRTARVSLPSALLLRKNANHSDAAVAR
ncbi:MAG: recombination protein O N-terminal domain-containing protein, partial [Kiritimatiellae bacterium]|nr:recombination protein O N-terminal domain-containing protein [Kiritimatiellia bacterium]